LGQLQRRLGTNHRAGHQGCGGESHQSLQHVVQSVGSGIRQWMGWKEETAQARSEIH